MKTTLPRAIHFIALAILTVAAASAQGLHWKSAVKAMGKDMSSDVFCMPKMVKTVSDNGEWMILRVDKKMIYTVNPADKQYSETTFDEFDTLMGKMTAKSSAKSDEMKERMKNMPEAQRKMVEQMMGGGAKDTPATTKNTGEEKKIAGYNCTKYIIMQGEKELMTVWATQDIKEFAAMRKDFEEFARRTTARMPGMAAAFDELIKLPGFAMESQFGTMMTQEVASLERKNTPASEFDVPSGYTKVKSKWQEQLEKSGEKD